MELEEFPHGTIIGPGLPRSKSTLLDESGIP